MNLVTIGHWAFIIGLVLAALAGLFGEAVWMVSTLFVLGLIVGFLNVTEEESTSFLVAVIALLLVSVAGLQLWGIMPMIVGVLNNVIAFMSAAALVVALKQVLVFGRKRT